MRRIALALLLATVGSAYAQNSDGNALLLFHTSAGGARSDLLIGYVRGAIESERFYGYLLTATDERNPGARTVALTKHARFCVPTGANYNQGYDIVVKYLTDNPKDRHKIAFVLVRNALQDAWPCP